MRNRLLRPFLIVEFLIAIQAIFTFWSEVGGQYHLDLMFWPWKFGLSIAAAGLIVAITSSLVQNNGALTRLALTLCSFLILVVVVAGMVTYFYHLNEPPEQDEQTDDAPARISQTVPLPRATGVAAPDHGQPFLTAEGLLEFRHIRNCSVDPEAVDGVRIGLSVQPFDFRRLVRTPDLAETKEELLGFIESTNRG
jgi:hypothetical protein